jgi:hypothetical protein
MRLTWKAIVHGHVLKIGDSIKCAFNIGFCHVIRLSALSPQCMAQHAVFAQFPNPRERFQFSQP